MNKEPKAGPQYAMARVIRTPKKVPLIVGNLHNMTLKWQLLTSGQSLAVAAERNTTDTWA